MIVRELITRLGFSLNRTQLDNAEKGVQRVKDRAEEAATAFRNMAAAVVSFATVKAIVNIADEMQNIRTRIGQLPQTVGDAGDAFDEVARRASASGVKIDAYASLYTKVGNAAKDYITTQEDLLSITDTISQALVVGGASAQEASAVMTQFSQALASGVLQGDEFRSMAEAAPQYLDKLAETMKIPREQLKKMASEGKLTAREVIDATRKMSDYFGDKFKQMPMTVGRAMTVIGNRFARMLDKMNRDSNFVTTIANAFLSAFDKIEAGVYKLVDLFGGWGNMLRFVGIALSVALGAKALSILAAFRAASLLAMLPFIKIIAIITAVSLVLEDLYVWINGGDSLIGSLIGPWEEWRLYVMGAVEAVMAVFRWFGELIAAIAAAIVGAFTLDWNLFKTGLEGIGTLLRQVVGQWGIWIRDALVGAWTYASQIAQSVLSSVFDFVSAVLENIGKIIVGVFTLDPRLILDGMNGYTQTILSILPEWAVAIVTAFVNAFTAVTAYVTETFAAWGSMIYNAIFAPIVNAVSDAWNNVKGFASGVWEGAKSMIGLGSDAGAGTGGGDSLIGPWEEWRLYVMGAIEMVADAVKWLGRIIGGLAAILVGVFTFDWNLIVEGLKGVGGQLWDTIAEWAGYFWQSFTAVTSAIGTFIVDAFMGVFNTVAAFVTSIFENIGKMIVGVFTLDPQLFMDGLQGYTDTLLSVLPQWGQAIISAFANAFASVVTYLATGMVELGQMIYRAIFAPIVNAVTDAWNAAKSVVTGIGDKASGAWQATKSFFGAGEGAAPGTGGAMGAANTLAPSVAPAQLAPSAMGAAKPSINNTTTVNVTVPQGTSAEQTAYLRKAAQQSFSKQSDDKLARDLAVYAP